MVGSLFEKGVGLGNDFLELGINGTKLFVENGQIADYIICLARTAASPSSAKGLALFLVDTQSPGVKRSPLKTLGYDKQSEVIFNSVKVPKDYVLGHAGQAEDILERIQEIKVTMLTLFRL